MKEDFNKSIFLHIIAKVYLIINLKSYLFIMSYILLISIFYIIF